MILTLDQWSLGYEQILRDCRTSTPIIGTVLLLVSPATDSLCAAKIITHMLRSDEIPYTLTQCNNYHQLDYQLEHLEESIKSVICLNCGGGRSLVDKMPEDSKVFILDSHRPIHLQNIHAGRNVVVYLEQEGDIVSDGDYLSGDGAFSSSSSSDDDEEDGDDITLSQGIDDGSSVSSLEKEWDGDGDVDGDDMLKDDVRDNMGMEMEMEIEDEDTVANTSTAETDPLQQQQQQQQQEEEDNSTNLGDGDVNDDDMADAIEDALEDNDEDSVSSIARSNVINEGADNDAVDDGRSQDDGSARHYTHERKEKIQKYYATTYNGIPVSFVAWSLCSSLRFGGVGDLLWYGCVGVTDAYLHQQLDMDDYLGLFANLRTDALRIYPNALEGNERSFAADDGTLISGSAGGRIITSNTPMLPLLSHWSLFDSLKHSTAIASRSTNLGVVETMVLELLAVIGVPLIEAKQKWPFMSAKLRVALQNSLEEHCNTFAIEGIIVDQFLRVQGYNTPMSASDVSMAVSALVERDSGNSFINNALDALSNIKLLEEGVRLAKHDLVQLHAAASLLIERGGLVRLSHFRYAYITGDVAGISGALGLGRLAAFLMDLHRTNGKWSGNKALPLILLLENPSKMPYTLISAHNYSTDSVVTPSKFHTQLALTAESLPSCQMELDGFDGCIVRVEGVTSNGNNRTGNVGQRFVEQLHYIMDAA